jgi:exosortase/archaeosortase family protein
MAKGKKRGIASSFGGKEAGRKPGIGFSFTREDARKSGRFLLFFVVVYLALSVVARGLIGIEAIELSVANAVLGMLETFGQAGSVSFTEVALIQLESGVSIEISELCTGLMEFMIIVGAILASVGISLRRRLIGAAVAGVATVLLNFLRIVVTALVILGTGDLVLIEFTHNVLFRAFLFVSIAGIYIAWFYWAASKEMGKK